MRTAAACALTPSCVCAHTLMQPRSAVDGASRRHAAFFMRLRMLYSDLLWEWRPDLARALRAALPPQLRAQHALMHVASATPTRCGECLLPGALSKSGRCRCVCYCDAACHRAA